MWVITFNLVFDVIAGMYIILYYMGILLWYVHWLSLKICQSFYLINNHVSMHIVYFNYTTSLQHQYGSMIIDNLAMYQWH